MLYAATIATSSRSWRLSNVSDSCDEELSRNLDLVRHRVSQGQYGALQVIESAVSGIGPAQCTGLGR